MKIIKMKFVKLLLKVIIIILILFFIFVTFVPKPVTPTSYIDKAKYDLARPKMVLIESAIDAYYINTGQYPKMLEDLLVCPLGLKDVWKGPYLKRKLILDPWDNKYIYEPNINNSGDYDLISYGADGKPGGKGKNEDVHRYKPIDDFAIDPKTGGMM